jgi:polyhydroxybutyrate depolymerase
MDLLIDQLVAEYHVDPGHVVAIGYANGGMLAYRLACELAASVSAIGVQSSAFERQACTPTRSVSVLHIHGTDDRNLPIDGGVGSESSANITFLSPRIGVQTLASAEGCAPRATEVTDPDNDDILTRTWSPCSGNAVVAMKEVTGASHGWMGSATSNDNPYAGLDASAVLWQFVAGHVR